MKPRASLMLAALAAGFVAFGSLSTSWFRTSVHGIQIEEGIFASKVCGFGLDQRDELEEFGRYQETGVMPPPKPWVCERELTVAVVTKVRRLADALDCAVSLIALLAGLALSLLLLVSLRSGRPGKAVTVLAIVALAGAVLYCIAAIALGGYAPTEISYGALAYVAGAVGALVARHRSA